jgi:hypothetical protein
MIPYIHAELSAKRFGGIPEDFLLELFGDHTRVIIHSNGTIETDDYEHD